MEKGQYKYEHIESRLSLSKRGKELLNLIDVHISELNYLLNSNRNVKLIWHKNKGPLLVHLIMSLAHPFRESQKKTNPEPIYLQSIADVLIEYGSDHLKSSLFKFKRWLRIYYRNGITENDILTLFNLS